MDNKKQIRELLNSGMRDLVVLSEKNTNIKACIYKLNKALALLDKCPTCGGEEKLPGFDDIIGLYADENCEDDPDCQPAEPDNAFTKYSNKELVSKLKYLLEMPYCIVQKVPERLSVTIGYITNYILEVCNRLEATENTKKFLDKATAELAHLEEINASSAKIIKEQAKQIRRLKKAGKLAVLFLDRECDDKECETCKSILDVRSKLQQALKEAE